MWSKPLALILDFVFHSFPSGKSAKIMLHMLGFLSVLEVANLWEKRLPLAKKWSFQIQFSWNCSLLHLFYINIIFSIYKHPCFLFSDTKTTNALIQMSYTLLTVPHLLCCAGYFIKQMGTQEVTLIFHLDFKEILHNSYLETPGDF